MAGARRELHRLDRLKRRVQFCRTHGKLMTCTYHPSSCYCKFQTSDTCTSKCKSLQLPVKVEQIETQGRFTLSVSPICLGAMYTPFWWTDWPPAVHERRINLTLQPLRLLKSDHGCNAAQCRTPVQAQATSGGNDNTSRHEWWREGRCLETPWQRPWYNVPSSCPGPLQESSLLSV